jgi:hypothetical protein
VLASRLRPQLQHCWHIGPPASTYG